MIKLATIKLATIALCALTASCASHVEDNTMQTTSETSAAVMSSEAIGAKLLRLIDSIRGRQDLAPTRIEEVMGLTLSPESGTVYLHGTRGQITQDWSFRLGTLASGADGADSLLFSINNADGDGADRTAVCQPDFDAYKSALQASGFSPAPVPGERGSTRFWEFTRDQVTVRIQTIGESAAKPEHACVSTISVSTSSAGT